MGWTSYNAKNYKNGKVDVKKECDEAISGWDCQVLRSVLKGSVWYGAVKLKDGRVIGMVVLTSVRNNDYYNFAYKDIDESCGPGYYDCPKAIINMLTPTDNEWANEWRQKCLNRKKEKSTIEKLNELPIGTTIQYTLSNGAVEKVYKHPAGYQFKKPFWMHESNTYYVKKKYIPDNFEIVESF